RGTYTTRARNKKFNRQSEILLREAEVLGGIAHSMGRAYDQRTLNESWKLLLLNQFHDVLPGSSIDEVYADSDRHYARILKDVSEEKNRTRLWLARKVDTRGEGIPAFVFNSLSWERRGTIAVEVPDLRKDASYVAVAADGQKSAVQFCSDARLRFVGRVPSLGHAVFHIRPGEVPHAELHADSQHLENQLLRLEFDKRGRLLRVFDKEANREVLEPGSVGNQFILYEDKPVNWPSWDIDIFYEQKPLEFDGEFLSAEVVEQGPVRAVLRLRRRISRSEITQDVVITSGSRRIDFETTVDWGDEKDVLLKVAFPLNVLTERARYEIQFGNVERPTHRNRMADLARFEVVGHRWADLSEADYGVALLNDGKYGHDAHGHVLRLTLLRAPREQRKTPDVNEVHRFTYSLFPHTGGYTNGVVRAGYELNTPFEGVATRQGRGPVPPRWSWLSVSAENVVVDTVKKAEDDGAIVVRMYECHGCRSRCSLRTALPVRRVFETDLMEQVERPVRMTNGSVALSFRPFQIRTIKLVL
ncbi:MAG: glycosyl hydrolase-related protein, partial [Kiritimatiellae bacterium]|nr:glycosyl hydrolase-related protein [Kiritimatiellia bacterium]